MRPYPDHPSRLILMIAGLGVGLLVAEISVRLTGADRPAVNRALSYSMADLPVRQPDPGFLQYRSRPGAAGTFTGRWGAYSVSIGPLGDRGGQLSATRRPGTQRIAIIGASTVFGAEVSDDETLSASLQRALGTRELAAEVGNFGVSAWVSSQIAYRGRELLWADLDLDLILFVHTNQGPRPFLWPGELDNADLSPWFDRDPQRWLEHIPGAGLPDSVHLALLRHSAAWRLVSARLKGEGRASRKHAHALGRQQVSLLLEESAQQGVRTEILLWPEGWDGWPEDLPDDAVAHSLDLDEVVFDPARKIEHPPAEGLQWYGERIADLIVQREWLAPKIEPVRVPPASPRPRAR